MEVESSCTALRVLLIEDSEHDAFFLLRELERDSAYEVISERVQSTEAFRAALDSGSRWDVIVCDYFLPGFGALEALALLHEKDLDLPFIIVSGSVGEEAAVAAMRAGARDYIKKNDLARLRPAIEREVREAEVRRERKRVEEALQRSESELVAAQRIAHLGSWSREMTTDVLRWSDEMYRIFGFTPQEFVVTYEKFLSLIHPDDKDFIQKALCEGQRSFEYRIVRPSGEIRFVHTRYEVERDASNRPIKLIGTLQDITERKHIEEALRESEERFRLLAENAQDVVYRYRVKPEPGFEYLSPSVESLTGYTPEEYYAHPELEAKTLHPEDSRLPEEMLLSEADPKLPPTLRLVRKDGTIIWLEQHEKLLYDEAGDLAAIEGIARDITERKQAEEALRASEERFRGTFEQSPLSIQILAPDGRTLRVNKAWERIWGITPEQLGDYNVLEDEQLVAKGVMPYIEKGFAGEPTTIPSIAYVSEEGESEGEARWVRGFIYPVKDETGNVLEVVLMFEDMTERKEAEELFRATFEQAAVGVAHVGTDGRWLRVNQKLCDIVGYTPEELLEKTFQDLTHPEDLDTELEHRGRLVAGEIGTYCMEKRYFRKDGSAVWTNLTVSCVRSPSGEPDYFISIIEDVSQRKRAEEELKRSEERFRSLIRNASDIFLILDTDGTICYESPAVERVIGFRPEERIGTNAFDHLHPDDRNQMRDDFDRLLENPDHRLSTEYRVRNKQGHWRHFEAIGANLLHDPSIRGVVVNTRDITERKMAEKALLESEERYRTFIEQSTEGICRFELERPLPTDAAEDDQVDHLYSCGRLVECNDAMARMHGYALAEEMVDTRLGDLLPRSVPENTEYLRAFVRSGYRVDDVESHEVDRQGEIKYFLNNLTGIIEDGSLTRVWKTQRDISERREIQRALRQSEELYRTVIEQAAENIYLVDLETKRILESNAALHRSLGYTMEELRELTLYDIIAHDQESVDRNIQDVADEGHFFVGERKYRCRDGLLIDVEVSASIISYQGKQVMCVVAHDVTERKRAEDRLRRSLDSLLALYEASQVLSSTLEAQEVGSRLLKIMKRLSNLTTAVLSTPDEHQQVHVWREIGLENLPGRLRYTPKLQKVFQEVLESGEHRLFRLERPGEDIDPLVGLCLPLRIKNRTIGLLEVYGTESLLEEDTVEILSSMTSQAASALENAQLYGELAERERRLQELVGQLLTAQEEERRRVAYEVHDSVAQVAGAAHQHLQTFARRYPPLSERSSEDLERVIRLVRQTVREARHVIAALRPAVLDDFGLSVALYQEIEELRTNGWRVDYEENLGEKRLPTAVEITLFRVAQEALANARKHGQTRRARVELRRWKDMVSLEVQDWGRGFDPEALENKNGPGERIGLSGMRERIAMIGGEFEISSSVGEGTSVRASVPLSGDLEED